MPENKVTYIKPDYSDSKVLSALVECITGKPLYQLVEECRRNENGLYDLFTEEEKDNAE